ncbi:MAG: hypothetical protein J6K85_02775 [Clostridia bacterium]|nr:hypothetical protein [Clostridia bacterium]
MKIFEINIADILKNRRGNKNEMQLKTKIIISLVLGILSAAVLFYVFLPPINLMSKSFWVYLTAVIAAFSLPFLKLGDGYVSVTEVNGRIKKSYSAGANKWLLLAVAVPILVLILGNLVSSPLFNARRYAGIIEVKESDFATDLPESNEVTNIALMDTASAMILGNRTLGSLSHVVSQYTVSDTYTQINYKNTPKKVANLEYDGFFKWVGNRDNGIPGLVIVDPVNSSAEYVELAEPIHYVESGYFGDDLMRKLRFMYPTKIFDYDSISFELDDEGNPYYIISCYRPKVALFGAKDVTEVIIFDPTDASSELYKVADTPAWVDIVYDGYLATEKYNWHGTLSGGYLNSIIGNVGCKMATDDFGYIVIDDDVWYFTGVTSAVSNDKSNIGFILSNARTGEYKFYPVIGAEEHSAMAAAEGEVQEKGYVASFPSLVNISGQATYIMVLKDAAGLVKLYALVNVENYSIVATGATQADAMSAYKKLLRQNDIEIGADDQTAEITVKDVEIVMLSGVATVYIKADDGKVYKGYLEADEALILIEPESKLKINYTESGVDKIFIISSWEFAK